MLAGLLQSQRGVRSSTGTNRCGSAVTHGMHCVTELSLSGQVISEASSHRPASTEKLGGISFRTQIPVIVQGAASWLIGNVVVKGRTAEVAKSNISFLQ